MDINYFLLLKSKYTIILDNLNSIISECDDICDHINENDSLQNTKLCILFNSDVNRNFFIEKRRHIYDLKVICDQRIYSLCKHNFITESIDIDPDTSKTITFCDFCGLNQRL
jgi:hypothetical protein